MIRERVRNLLVGLVTIGAGGGLVALMLLFGELDAFVRPRYAITINTDHAAGLRRGSAVELNGVPIGIIDQIEIHPGVPRPVQVLALIDQGIGIPQSAVPYATSSLLGGAAVLEIEATIDGDTALMLQDGTASIDATIRSRMIEQLTAELDTRMGPLMTALEQFETLSATYVDVGRDLRELSETYVDVGRNINGLFEPQSDEALEAGASPNLHTALRQAYGVMDDTRAAIALAREWLADEQLRADARTAVERASTLMDQASETLARLTRLADGLETDASKLVQRVLPVADEAALTLEEIRRLTRLAADGDGTVSLLLNEPDLYRSLNDAAVRLEQAVREVKLLAEKIKAEGLPVGF